MSADRMSEGCLRRQNVQGLHLVAGVLISSRRRDSASCDFGQVDTTNSISCIYRDLKRADIHSLFSEYERVNLGLHISHLPGLLVSSARLAVGHIAPR